MFKKPILWIVFVLFSIGCAIFAFNYFSSAYPIVTIDLKMDRETALESARDLAQKNNWGPRGFDQAASFKVNSRVQNFVELEAGGTEALKKMMDEGLYSTYTWRVRNYKEGEKNETIVRFTPAGEPYGFRERLAESEPGAGLTSDSARIIAESAAGEKWNINLAEYNLAEKSQEVRLSKRIDHTFVYERPDIQIGEGRYRIRLIVSGDKLTELTHFVKVPEGFLRRYEEMRSANETISMIALFAIGLLYVLGGIAFGLFFLLRRRWVLWRKPLFWGLFVALLQLLSDINNWPLAWMNYDTALSAQGFLLQQIMHLLLNFLFLGALLTLSFMAAESLTRKAFPNHIQLWRLWKPDVAGSTAVLGRTVSGYLFVTVFFAFDIALYFFATQTLGWWSPSGALFEPDVLAAYFPWLSSIAISLQAGFMEECLFRAIPIAGAALIGQRFGCRRAWIIAAFILQALIFGAGHANYANQPAYARVVELIIPSLAFGLIYLSFGLLPAIIMHFAYDVVWFALPLFVSSASGIWIDQTLVITLTFIPLFVVIWARLRTKQWKKLKEEDFNRSWQPSVKSDVEMILDEIKETHVVSSSKIPGWLLAGGIIGLVIWIFTTNFQNYAPSLTIGRSEAKETAQKILAEHNVELSESWQTLSCVVTPLDQNDRFVWQTSGKETYQALMGQYLTPPRWKVRFVQFEGDVAERAEEYQVYIAEDGGLVRFRHILPETKAGAVLAEDSARIMAHSVLQNKFNLDPLTLKEISAVPSKLPERKDWTFTFKDTLKYSLTKGETRINVNIAGANVVDSYRYVYVPDEWARQERNQFNIINIFRNLSGIVALLIFLIGIAAAIVSWSRKKFSVPVFLSFFAITAILKILDIINNWPATIAGFSTAEPFSNQMIIAAAGPVVGTLFLSLAAGLIAGFIQSWKNKSSSDQPSNLIWLGFSLGALIAGLSSLISLIEPSLKPLWAEYDALNNYIPIAAGINPLASYIMKTILYLLIFTALDKFTDCWTKRKALFSVLFILLILIISGSSINSLASWLISGLLMGIVYLLLYQYVFRFRLALIPLTFGTVMILGELKQGILNAYPAAIPAAVISIILIGLFSIYWYKKLLKE